jgi:hypothetical protein
MFSSEIPITSPSSSSLESGSEERVVFDVNGVLVDAREFDPKNGDDAAASAAEKMLQANELARAEDAGAPSSIGIDHKGTSVMSPEKTSEAFLEEFTARLDEAMLNLDSMLDFKDGDAVVGLGVMNFREGAGKNSKNEVKPDEETEFRFSEWARKRKAALLLVVGFSLLPQSASAKDAGLLEDMWKIVTETTKGAVKQKTGEMARKPWEIARQRENEAEMKRNQEKSRQQQAEFEHQSKIRQFESATTRYRDSLRQTQLQFDRQFNQTKDSFANQSAYANTPEQVKAQERNKWFSWLELSRSTIQGLKQQDAQYEQAGGSQSEESWQMQSKLQDFVKKAEAKLGIQNDEESPLKATSGDSFEEEFRPISTQPRRSGVPSGNYERGPGYSYPSR